MSDGAWQPPTPAAAPTGSASSAGFRIDPDAVRSVAGNLGGMLMQAVTVSRDLERLALAPGVFAGIGVPVASGSTALHSEQLQALHSVLRLLSDIGSQVSQVAATARADDTDIAGGLARLTGGSAPAGSGSAGGASAAAVPSPSTGGLWGSATAAQLASTAMTAGAPVGSPHPVDAVLDQLGQAGMGQLATHPVPAGSFGSPVELANWLDTDPDNQTRLGVIGVYAGNTGNLGDVPGGLHPGDVVYADRWQLSGPELRATSAPTLGIVGSDGNLYNHGPISTTDWTGVTDLRVYRPIGAL